MILLGYYPAMFHECRIPTTGYGMGGDPFSILPIQTDNQKEWHQNDLFERYVSSETPSGFRLIS